MNTPTEFKTSFWVRCFVFACVAPLCILALKSIEHSPLIGAMLLVFYIALYLTFHSYKVTLQAHALQVSNTFRARSAKYVDIERITIRIDRGIGEALQVTLRDHPPIFINGSLLEAGSLQIIQAEVQRRIAEIATPSGPSPVNNILRPNGSDEKR